ncbi:MAG: hypothetical protein KDC93_02640 [Cyclobacteriaceae bacterium]|nr:hypothetical protein [Cyclobacteriaceae bacterium]
MEIAHAAKVVVERSFVIKEWLMFLAATGLSALAMPAHHPLRAQTTASIPAAGYAAFNLGLLS